MKLFRDLSLVLVISCPNIGCLSSFICLVFSISVVTRHLISGGAMPARRYSLYGRRWSKTSRYDSAGILQNYRYIFGVFGLATQNGHAYSPVEKHRAIPVVRMV